MKIQDKRKDGKVPSIKNLLDFLSRYFTNIIVVEQCNEEQAYEVDWNNEDEEEELCKLFFGGFCWRFFFGNWRSWKLFLLSDNYCHFLNFSQIFLILMNNRVTYILNKERTRKLRKIMIIVSFYCPQHFSSAWNFKCVFESLQEKVFDFWKKINSALITVLTSPRYQSNSLEEEKAITLIWIWHYNHDLFGNQHVIFFLPPLKSFSNPAPKQQQTNQLKIHTIQFNSNKLLIRVLAWKVAIQYFFTSLSTRSDTVISRNNIICIFFARAKCAGRIDPLRIGICGAERRVRNKKHFPIYNNNNKSLNIAEWLYSAS